ncbi:hypothetical protein D9M69_615140 [compost metagenome]
MLIIRQVVYHALDERDAIFHSRQGKFAAGNLQHAGRRFDCREACVRKQARERQHFRPCSTSGDKNTAWAVKTSGQHTGHQVERQRIARDEPDNPVVVVQRGVIGKDCHDCWLLLAIDVRRPHSPLGSNDPGRWRSVRDDAALHQ